MTASRGLHGTEENTGSERGSLATSDLLATPPSLGPQVLHTRGGASEPRSAEASLGGWSLTGSVRDEAPSSRPGRHTWAYFFAVGPTMHTPLTASFKLGCLLFICSPGFLPGCDFLGSGLRMGSQFRAHGSSLSPTVPRPPRQAHRTVWNGWGCLKPEAPVHLPHPDWGGCYAVLCVYVRGRGPQGWGSLSQQPDPS